MKSQSPNGLATHKVSLQVPARVQELPFSELMEPTNAKLCAAPRVRPRSWHEPGQRPHGHILRVLCELVGAKKNGARAICKDNLFLTSNPVCVPAHQCPENAAAVQQTRAHPRQQTLVLGPAVRLLQARQVSLAALDARVRLALVLQRAVALPAQPRQLRVRQQLLRQRGLALLGAQPPCPRAPGSAPILEPPTEQDRSIRHSPS